MMPRQSLWPNEHANPSLPWVPGYENDSRGHYITSHEGLGSHTSAAEAMLAGPRPQSLPGCEGGGKAATSISPMGWFNPKLGKHACIGQVGSDCVGHPHAPPRSHAAAHAQHELNQLATALHSTQRNPLAYQHGNQHGTHLHPHGISHYQHSAYITHGNYGIYDTHDSDGIAQAQASGPGPARSKKSRQKVQGVRSEGGKATQKAKAKRSKKMTNKQTSKTEVVRVPSDKIKKPKGSSKHTRPPAASANVKLAGAATKATTRKITAKTTKVRAPQQQRQQPESKPKFQANNTRDDTRGDDGGALKKLATKPRRLKSKPSNKAARSGVRSSKTLGKVAARMGRKGAWQVLPPEERPGFPQLVMPRP